MAATARVESTKCDGELVSFLIYVFSFSFFIALLRGVNKEVADVGNGK